LEEEVLQARHRVPSAACLPVVSASAWLSLGAGVAAGCARVPGLRMWSYPSCKQHSPTHCWAACSAVCRPVHHSFAWMCAAPLVPQCCCCLHDSRECGHGWRVQLCLLQACLVGFGCVGLLCQAPAASHSCCCAVWSHAPGQCRGVLGDETRPVCTCIAAMVFLVNSPAIGRDVFCIVHVWFAIGLCRVYEGVEWWCFGVLCAGAPNEGRHRNAMSVLECLLLEHYRFVPTYIYLPRFAAPHT
jgi:hypothetical protein